MSLPNKMLKMMGLFCISCTVLTYSIVTSASHASLKNSKSSINSTNPISYTLNPTTGIPSTTSIGSSYSVIYTLTNNLPFAEPLKQILKTTRGIGFSVNDNCSNTTLAANGGTCNIDIRFQPVQVETASVQLTLQYDKNVVPLPALSTNVQDPSTTEISGVVTSALPADTTVGTGYPVKFTFINDSGASITASSTTLTGDTGDLSNIVNGCNSAFTTFCDITATFTPSSAGSLTVGATFSYNGGTKSVALSTHTLASNGSGGCTSVAGSTELLLPTHTYIYADNVVKFIFTNHCDSTSATLGTVGLSATLGSSSVSKKNINNKKVGSTNVSSWLIRGSDTCSGTILGANGTCSVSVSTVPTGTGSNLNIDAVVSYTESAKSKTATASSTATSVLTNDSTQRVITVINQCEYSTATTAPNNNIWMTFLPGAVNNTPCAPTAPGRQNCPQGSVCLNSANAGLGLCYWSNPSLDASHPNGLLKAAKPGRPPDTINFNISETNGGTSNNTIYNAGIAARRNCSGTGSSLFCAENNCGSTVTPAAGSTGSDGMCTPGIGVSSYPAMSFNAVEFTFNRSSANGATDGVYDEQTINGVNVPIEMKGRGPSTVNPSPYDNCPAIGAPIQPTTGSAATQLGQCTYNYVTPVGHDPANYIFVTPNTSPYTTCSQSSPCSGGYTCGLGYNANTGFIDRLCGVIQGYVSVNTAICAQATSNFAGSLGTTLHTEYNCGTNFTNPTPPGGTTLGSDLYACSGTYAGVSCYTHAAGTSGTCCGCQDWWTSPTNLTVPTSTQSCTFQGTTFANANWLSTVLSQIQWVKTACPTAYAFQYDDESSQFYCTVTNSSSQIVSNYQVTFCPGGKSL